MPLSTGAAWPALANRTASAADLTAKFEWLEGDRLPMSNGILTTSVFDIGASAKSFSKAFFSNGLIIDGNTITSSSTRSFKAWAAIWDFYNLGSYVATIVESFNFSALFRYSEGDYLLTYTTPMTTAHPVISACSDEKILITSATVNNIRINHRDKSTGALYRLNHLGIQVIE